MMKWARWYIFYGCSGVHRRSAVVLVVELGQQLIENHFFMVMPLSLVPKHTPSILNRPIKKAFDGNEILLSEIHPHLQNTLAMRNNDTTKLVRAYLVGRN